MDKYKLPPTHDLFQKQSMAELNLEWFEDLFSEKASTELRMEDADPKERIHLEKRLGEICKILGEDTGTGDLLTDYWDEQIARGEKPDLELTVDDVKRIKGLL